MFSDSLSAALRQAQWAQRKQVSRRRRQQNALRRLIAQASAPAACAPVRSPRQRAGDRYETLALHALQDAGLRLLARNLACHGGEIDLVMRDAHAMVFVEVRARARDGFGGAAASVGPAKQARLRHAAQFWLPGLVRRHWHGRMPACRFDVVAFEAGRPVWIRHAFQAD